MQLPRNILISEVRPSDVPGKRLSLFHNRQGDPVFDETPLGSIHSNGPILLRLHSADTPPPSPVWPVVKLREFHAESFLQSISSCEYTSQQKYLIPVRHMCVLGCLLLTEWEDDFHRQTAGELAQILF